MKNVVSNLNPLTCFIISTHMRPKEFDSLNNMRTRELKNFLIRNINVDAKLISQIFDRKELIQLALSSEEKYGAANYFNRNEFVVVICRLLIYIILGYMSYKCRHIINDILLDPFTSCYYRIILKAGWMKKCLKKYYILSFVAFLISCIIDIYGPLIQLRILVSWIAPPNSIVRILMSNYVPILSLSINPSLVTKNKNLASFINYGVDLGPIITLYSLKFVKHKLEDYACTKLLKHQNIRKNKKLKRHIINSTDDLNFGDGNFKLD